VSTLFKSKGAYSKGGKSMIVFRDFVGGMVLANFFAIVVFLLGFYAK